MSGLLPRVLTVTDGESEVVVIAVSVFVEASGVEGVAEGVVDVAFSRVVVDVALLDVESGDTSFVDDVTRLEGDPG